MDEIALLAENHRNSKRLLKRVREKANKDELRIHELASEVLARATEIKDRDKTIARLQEQLAKNNRDNKFLQSRPGTSNGRVSTLRVFNGPLSGNGDTSNCDKCSDLIKQYEERIRNFTSKLDNCRLDRNELRTKLERKTVRILELEYYETQYHTVQGLYDRVSDVYIQKSEAMKIEHQAAMKEMKEECKKFERKYLIEKGNKSKWLLNDRVSVGNKAGSAQTSFLTSQVDQIWNLDKNNLLVAPADKRQEITVLNEELLLILSHARQSQILNFEELDTRLRALLAMTEDFIYSEAKKDKELKKVLPDWLELIKQIDENLVKGRTEWEKVRDKGSQDTQSSTASDQSRILSGNPPVRDFSYSTRKRKSPGGSSPLSL